MSTPKVLILIDMLSEMMIVINKDIISLENINIFIGETQPSG